eukprot:1024318-Amphidinium_carterae.1
MHLKSKHEGAMDDEPKAISTAERMARHKAAELGGLDLQGDFDYSLALLNKVRAQAEKNILMYIPPSECTT